MSNDVGAEFAVTKRRVQGDGVDLAVFERGQGPTVLLVHGFPDTHAVWDAVAERLAVRFHVVTYDVRGAGDSSRPSGRDAYRFEHLVADMRAVLDAVSPQAPVHLAGHDWGSIQSWEALYAMPERRLTTTSHATSQASNVGRSTWPVSRRAWATPSCFARVASPSA